VVQRYIASSGTPIETATTYAKRRGSTLPQRLEIILFFLWLGRNLDVAGAVVFIGDYSPSGHLLTRVNRNTISRTTH
jgi:hypothetical protein